MSSKLIPANPADVLVVRDVTPNITTLSVPFKRLGLFNFGGRGTIVRMSSGGVLVFSPVALTDEAVAVVRRLSGDEGVKYLVAGDIEHHIFLSEWAKAYPKARIIGPTGLPEKRAATQGSDPKINVNDPFFFVVPSGTSGSTSAAAQHDPKTPISIAADFDADFACAYVDAHPNREIVLLYKPDRVLIEADLLMNLPATEQYSRTDAATQRTISHPNLLNRIFTRLMTTEGDAMAARRLLWYGMSAHNRPRFNAAVQLVDSWDFDTIIPCHGEVLQKDGKQVFRKIFAWHLE